MLQAFDSRHFCSKSRVDDEDNDVQIYLMFQPFINILKVTNSDHILEWKLKWLSDENIKAPAISNNSLAPALNYSGLDHYFKSPFYSWSIFGVANYSSVHADNKKNDFLIHGKNSTQSLDDTLLTADAQYYINFSEQLNKFCLSLHYNDSNNFLFVNAVRAKESDLNIYLIGLGNISKDFTVNNMKNNI